MKNMEECTRKRVGELSPADYNPRKISKAQLAALGRSMQEFGDLSGIVVNVNGNRVIGGHQRIKHLDPSWAIEKKPAKDSTGTVADGWIQTPYGRIAYREVKWSETKEKAANLAANKHGGSFDMEAVASMLKDLEGKIDLDLTGFLEGERFSLFGDDKSDKDPDHVPTGGAARTKRGDVWLMGEHRLVCGDSTNKADWAKLFHPFKSKPASLVFTDPPYGVSYEAKSGEFDVIEGDKKRGDELLSMLASALKLAVKNSEDTAAFYVWHASSTREDFATSLKAAGLQERQYLIWAKPGIVLGHSDYRWAHEPCFYASKADHKAAFYGDRAQPTVWRLGYSEAKQVANVIGPGIAIIDGRGGMLYIQGRAPKAKKLRTIRLEPQKTAVLAGMDDGSGTLWEVGKDHGYEHPTQKPVELARRAIVNSSKAGEIVADPFLGSGTTLMGAEITGRICYGMELDPKYADVIVNRWERFTGRKATKEK